MNLEDFRQRVVSKLQERGDTKVNVAVNVRASAFQTTDQYAVAVSEALAEARAYADAAAVINEEFKKLERPEQRPEENAAVPRKGDVY